MKKLLLTAAVTAALFAGQASAVVPTIPGVTTPANLQVDFSAATGIGSLTALPATNVVYLAGSSAATKFLNSAIQGIAEPASVVYKYQNAAKDIITYVFTAKAGVTGFTAGSTYVVHKRDRGGSVTAALAASAATPDKAALVTFNQIGVITKAAVLNKDLTIKTAAVRTPGSLLVLNIPCSAPAAVTGFTSTLATCTATVTTTDPIAAVAPKTAALVGLADVDAAQFGSPLNGADGNNKLAAAVLKMKSTAIAAQVFGVAVNLKLRNAMQVAEMASGALPASCATAGTATGNQESEACMPSFTSAQMTSLFAQGRMNDWTNLSYGAGNLVSANSGNTPANTAVHLCSRAAGSGTLATFNTVFENAPCLPSDKNGNQLVTEAIQAAPDTVNSSTTEGANGSAKAYHSTVGSGDLENCLATMDGYDSAITTGDKYANGMTTEGSFNLPALAGTANFRWAVGILNADRNTSNALPYRFVKIDGYAPSLVNTANGKYKYWSELAVLDKLVPSTAVAAVTANALITVMTDPLMIVKSKATNPAGFVTGYMATAAMADGTATAFDIARPVMPFTHSNGAGAAGTLNHCRIPAILSGNKLLPGLN